MQRNRPFVALLLSLVLLPVAAAPAPATVHTLTVHGAIALATKNNVDVLVSKARKRAAASGVTQARATLLPHLSADVSQSRQQVNLAARGIPFAQFPGIPATSTYNTFQARLVLRQSLINISQWQQYFGAQAAQQAAVARLHATREQIAAQTALQYIETVRARQAVKATRADVKLAKKLVGLAKDQHSAGVASGVDVTRAQTALAQRKVQLAKAHTKADRAGILLARITGLPLGSRLQLTTGLDLPHISPPAPQIAIHKALQQRPEMQLTAKIVEAAQHRLSAARGNRLPSLGLTGSYGRTGNTPTRRREETYRIGIQLDIPIFSGGAIHGVIGKAASKVDQARLRQRDTHEQIEQDVRLALRSLDTSSQQLHAARASLKLAQRELKLSRDRFAAGVTDNIEVIDAQTSLANARSALVAALAQYASTRVNLAAAIGKAQSIAFGADHE